MRTSTIEVTLSDMAHGGDAVGHVEGQAVFVPLGIPGERVCVEIEERRRGILRGRLVEVLAPSADRVMTPCPYFGQCGGCQWQHLRYEAQLAWKERIVRAQLQRIGRQAEPQVWPMIGLDPPWAYRNHVQLRPAPGGGLGYYALRSHDVVSVARCLIAHDLLTEIWHALELGLPGVQTVSLRAGAATGDRMIVIEGRGAVPPAIEGDPPFSLAYMTPQGETIPLAGRTYLEERLQGLDLCVSAPSFFQVNTVQAERLVELVLKDIAPQPGETLWDVYCGVGTFALALARYGASVVGIESAPWSIADATINAERNGLQERCTFHQGDAAQLLPQLQVPCDAVVVDPPRAGCDPAVLQELARRKPSRLVYVSCDPATLARDTLRLDALGYELAHVQPVDMFPQTYHIECVALWRPR